MYVRKSNNLLNKETFCVKSNNPTSLSGVYESKLCLEPVMSKQASTENLEGAMWFINLVIRRGPHLDPRFSLSVGGERWRMAGHTAITAIEKIKNLPLIG